LEGGACETMLLTPLGIILLCLYFCKISLRRNQVVNKYS
jgi:hypothetical protein